MGRSILNSGGADSFGSNVASLYNAKLVASLYNAKRIPALLLNSRIPGRVHCALWPHSDAHAHVLLAVRFSNPGGTPKPSPPPSGRSWRRARSKAPHYEVASECPAALATRRCGPYPLCAHAQTEVRARRAPSASVLLVVAVPLLVALLIFTIPPRDHPEVVFRFSVLQSCASSAPRRPRAAGCRTTSGHTLWPQSRSSRGR